MKLFLVHCGFYDQTVSGGLFESHTNYFVVAQDIDEAKLKAKGIREFQDKRMHIDGLQELVSVDGYAVQLTPNPDCKGETVVLNHSFRELAKKPTT